MVSLTLRLLYDLVRFCINHKLPYSHKGEEIISYYLYLIFLNILPKIGLQYFRNKKSLFVYYELTILARA